jgi:thiol:disulfide interchange protein DsbD
LKRIICILLFSLCLWSLGVKADFLPVDQAFQVGVTSELEECTEACLLDVRVQVADHYYLYRERFRLEPSAEVFGLEFVALPKGLRKYDEFLKQEIEALRGELHFQIRFSVKSGVGAFAGNVGNLVLQGCADEGLCYPPMQVPLRVGIAGAGSGVGTGLLEGKHSFGDLLSPPRGLDVELSSREGGAVESDSLSLRTRDDSASRLAVQLMEQSWWVVLPVFFGLGILLAFTPCLLPMLPIVSGLVLGRRGAIESRARPLGLALVYVFGMALTYALLGVAAGLSGYGLAAALQSAAVLWTLGGLVAVFGVALLCGVSLQVPSGVQSWISAQTGRLPGGRVLPVLLMGLLSGLLLGPCVAPPLAGALLYIGQTGDAMLGGAVLFMMALGMGVPLMLFVGGAGAVLPKSGPWMHWVSLAFGFLLLAVALWMVAPVTPVPVFMGLWMGWAVLVAALVFRRALSVLARWVSVGFGALALVFAFGLLSGASSVLNPLERVLGGQERALSVVFQRVGSAEVLEMLRTGSRPVMLDFYADWCVSCKEFEHFTLPDAKVRERLEGFLLLQVDVTANSPEDQALLKQFGLFGPPAILFFPAGQSSEVFRVIGFENAERFSASLDLVRSRVGL